MIILNLKDIGGNIVKQDDRFTVRAGDVVPIKDGVFHKVYNDNNEDLYFVCVFDGNRAT